MKLNRLQFSRRKIFSSVENSEQQFPETARRWWSSRTNQSSSDCKISVGEKLHIYLFRMLKSVIIYYRQAASAREAWISPKCVPVHQHQASSSKAQVPLGNYDAIIWQIIWRTIFDRTISDRLSFSENRLMTSEIRSWVDNLNFRSSSD